MPRYINPEKIDFRLPYFKDENGDALVSLRAVKQCIDATPSEDVVPKSEYEAAIIDRNAARLGMIAEHERLKTAKADAAREIFEEFEEYLSEKKFGKFYYNYLKDIIAELKKKYKCKEDNE